MRAVRNSREEVTALAGRKNNLNKSGMSVLAFLIAEDEGSITRARVGS
jgi:hypothetical protein